MSDLDDLDELRKRLDKLKEFNQQQNKQNVTDDQLQEKLNRLKGLNADDAKSERNASYLVPAKFKSDVESADDLLKQLSDEVAVDSKFRSRYDVFDEHSSCSTQDDLLANLSNLSTDDTGNNFVSKPYDRAGEHGKVISQEELEKELDAIKSKMREFNYEYKDLSKNKNAAGQVAGQAADQANGKKNSKSNQLDPFGMTQSDSSEDETSYINLVRKFVDEVKLEKDTTGAQKEGDQRPGGSSKDEKSRSSSLKDRSSKSEADRPNDDEEEKLDFCYICSEDAVLICVDCDRERFCLQCFKEFHEDLEYRSHRYAKFNPRK